ncbi:Uncharacterised protein [Chryseobacterium taklimakanense]|uniref:Type VI secretion system baseplate subunit TssG n=1 Tax=Chryseobacterium taklimakanense TaxID=536441 RepID=A0A239WJX3_9FLAO|nr:hypothetical protein [Chryseobacterium taklimakanense]SNV34767.1 Uncharacterised protein [Chryseobacterium taklimakanense]
MKTDTTYIAELNYNTLGTDFKLEIVAANLLKYYRMSSNMFIKRIGINDRPFLKDVRNIYTNSYGFEDETLVLETYRESIYDYLPEGLFHPPSLGNYNKNVEGVVNEIRKQRQVEENARNFFQPFEIEIFNTEVAALIKETEFDIADKSDTLVNTLSELWPLLKKVDKETARTFFYILPFLHEVRGNRRWIERFLSAFLRVKVEIGYRPNVIDHKDDEEGFTRLGKTRLGITFIPNGQHMDGERNWQLNIGPLPYNQIDKYVPGHPFRKLLQAIYDYLIPISVKIFENFITVKTEQSFLLNDRGESSHLGYSTFI